MVRIRLRRMGLKGQPTYRVVITDKERPRDGAFIEIIGTYNPRTEPLSFQVDESRVLYWMSVGAQPSESVERLLKRNGTLDRFERLRKGETIDALAAEAQTNATQPSVKTRRDAPAQGMGAGKKPKKS